MTTAKPWKKRSPDYEIVYFHGTQHERRKQMGDRGEGGGIGGLAGNPWSAYPVGLGFLKVNCFLSVSNPFDCLCVCVWLSTGGVCVSGVSCGGREGATFQACRLLKTGSRDSMKSLNWWWQLMLSCQGCCSTDVNTSVFSADWGNMRNVNPTVGGFELHRSEVWMHRATSRLDRWQRGSICGKPSARLSNVSNSTYSLSLLPTKGTEQRRKRWEWKKKETRAHLAVCR